MEAITYEKVWKELDVYDNNVPLGKVYKEEDPKHNEVEKWYEEQGEKDPAKV